MSKANVGSLIVLEDGVADASGNVGHIRGIFTERDYLKKIVLEGRNSKETSITDIMTPKDVMLTIDPTHSVMEAMEMMVENQIRHLPVVDNDTLVGMVSIRDVVGTMVGEHKKSMEMMSNYINGTY
uniref:CBS domain-containing protein n=3 Tax=Tetraselmis chuii TaxID=63592 RepID=A0A7S1XA38_9CHLO|mmetsp:Transcript_5101/g.9264  ORF Transcript_5101/g.9264 Transcript_5101/m.9264 type:complete len:126 (+) Transcript_5101:233-610(+)